MKTFYDVRGDCKSGPTVVKAFTTKESLSKIVSSFLERHDVNTITISKVEIDESKIIEGKKFLDSFNEAQNNI